MTNNHLLIYRLAELMLEKQQHIIALDDLFEDEQIDAFVRSIQIDSPYQQLIFEGVLTETIKEERVMVTFTVEGYFHYVLGEVIEKQTLDKEAKALKELLENNKLRGITEGVEQCLVRDVEKKDLSRLMWLIDEGGKALEASAYPLAQAYTTINIDTVNNTLFSKISMNDIQVLSRCTKILYEKKSKSLNFLYKSLIKFQKKVRYDEFKIILIEAYSSLSKKDLNEIKIPNLKSKNISLQFRINYEMIYLYKKLNLYEKAESIINQNIELIKFYKSAFEFDDISSFYDSASHFYSNISNYEKALKFAKKALKYGLLNNNNNGVLLNNIGLRNIDLKNLKSGKKYLTKALNIDINLHGNYHPNIASRYNNLSLIHIENGEYTDAIELLEKALNIDINVYGDKHENVATRFINLSECYRKLSKLNKALDSIRKAHEIDLFNYGEEHPMLCYTYNIEAHIYSQMGSYKKAIETINKAIKINKKFNDGLNDKLTSDYNFKGILSAKMSDFKNAISSFIKADQIESKIFKNNPELRIITWLNICKSYKKLNKNKELNFYLSKIEKLPIELQNHYNDFLKNLKIANDQ